jgi:hypothetical protein
MTVSGAGVPRLHGTREEALRVAKKEKRKLFRQVPAEAITFLIYDPETEHEYEPRQVIVDKGWTA